MKYVCFFFFARLKQEVMPLEDKFLKQNLKCKVFSVNDQYTCSLDEK